MQPVDLVVLSNGPGEVTTWVRPVVKALRQQMGHNLDEVRISLILSPCPNASGREVAIARSYPEIDRVQAAEHFFPFLLRGKTSENWDWRDRGVVVFLGGDQFFPVVIGKRLGYRIVIYGEWETRWHRWVDRFGVMKPELVERVSPQYAHKLTVVGDLMAEAGSQETGALAHSPTQASNLKPQTSPDLNAVALSEDPLDSSDSSDPSDSSDLIGLLPGSKPAKLAQGLPLGLAIAQHIQAARPKTRFVIPVAPTLDLPNLVRFADPVKNPIVGQFGGIAAELVMIGDRPYLQTASGLKVELWTDSPAYPILSQCRLCLTTVGANTAELGSLAIPMIVLLPTQQLDAMRAWDGLPGLLANLPGVGTAFAKSINWLFLRRPKLLAWPNIWAGQEIVPELVGKLHPEAIATFAVDFLEHPEKLEQMRDRLRQVRGTPGAAQKLTQLIVAELESM